MRDWIANTSGIKLNHLAVCFYENMVNISYGLFYQVLNELYERGAYKRLQYYFYCTAAPEMVDELTTLNGLVKLYIDNSEDLVSLPALNNFEELATDNANKITANHYINLKRFYLRFAEPADLLPFIKHCVESRKIKVECLDGLEADIVDLPTWNRQREPLVDPQKITLYVNEKVYLATKWASKETNHPLICLKRIGSFEWEHDFLY